MTELNPLEQKVTSENADKVVLNYGEYDKDSLVL